MAVKKDNIHYSFRAIDGYNKDINIVISGRDPGKSSNMWSEKIYPQWKKDKSTWLILVRQVVEITEEYIRSIQDNIINKFFDDNVEFEFSKNSIKNGIVDVRINGELFFRLLAMSIPLRRIKQALLKGIRGILFDEFIINPKMNEKYLKGEAMTIKEIYTTYFREKKEGVKLKMYILGNPYSLYNPIFQWLNINPNDLEIGKFLLGKNYVVEWYKMKPELREKLLKENPMYEIDEDYSAYALGGEAILDKNIKLLDKCPPSYQLRFVFKFGYKFVGVFQNQNYLSEGDSYYCQYIENPSARRDIYCFDFEDLLDRCVLFNAEDKFRFNRLKSAIRNRKVAFSAIDVYYLIEEVYFNL